MGVDILNNSFDSLPLSEEFKRKAEQLGFQNIQEISATPPSVLIKLDGFDYHWFGELIDFLKSEDKLDALQRL